MPVNKLTARFVESAGPGKYNDGGGLWLVVRGDGSRAWMMRYTIGGKRREKGLGPTHTVSLAKAREKAREVREQVHDGLDPIAVKSSADERVPPIFTECAEAYISAQEPGWRNPKHRYQWRATIRDYANPVLGTQRVDEIDVQDVLRVLQPIWTTKTETASRLRGRIERILDWAKVRRFRSGENPARWKGNLDALLPKKSKVTTVKHLPAMPWRKVPAFLQELRRRKGTAARAVEFLILTAARPGEVRGASWEEIDTDTQMWTIPKERMKAGREHRTPLSGRAVAVLNDLPKGADNNLVFPSPTGKVMSDVTMTAVLRRMEVDVTVHGFRSSFRDWCAESTDYSREVAEMALAHSIPDAVEAAYRRGDLLEKRYRLMQDWADFLDIPNPTGTKEAPIRRRGD